MAAIPDADLRDPPTPLWFVAVAPGLCWGCVAWPTAVLLEALHLGGVVAQSAPVIALAVPACPVATMIVAVALYGVLGIAVPAVWHVAVRGWRSDLVRTRRVHRRVHRSTNRSDLLRYWHRVHTEALSAGSDPAEAVRRADQAVLRP